MHFLLEILQQVTGGLHQETPVHVLNVFFVCKNPDSRLSNRHSLLLYTCTGTCSPVHVHVHDAIWSVPANFCIFQIRLLGYSITSKNRPSTFLKLDQIDC